MQIIQKKDLPITTANEDSRELVIPKVWTRMRQSVGHFYKDTNIGPYRLRIKRKPSSMQIIQIKGSANCYCYCQLNTKYKCTWKL
jgi:hypothetical protein